jgi:NADPH:quinone reductase
MKAALYSSTGPAAEVLRVEQIDRPEPGPGEVLVRVHASGINPTDYKARSGAVPRPIDDFQVPHHDGAGVIEAVGAGVDPGRVGQRVWLWYAARRRWGTAAEWTVVPERQAVPLPEGIPFELGAQLGVPAMTAYHCVFADGPIDGKTVLVAGGAGAVGHFAIELAKRAGARVLATASGPEKAALAEKAGAGLVVNYRAPDAVEQVRAFAPVVDRVIEVALGANLKLDLAVAGPQTVIMTYAAEPQDPALPVRACMTANATLRFMLLYTIGEAALDRAAAGVTAALAAGDLTALPVRKYPLDDIAAAHDAAEAGGVGKVIVTPLSAVSADTEPYRQSQAAHADEHAERADRDHPGDLRTDPSADQEARRQRNHELPPHVAEQCETRRGHGVRHAGHGVLHRVHLDQRLGDHGAEHHEQHDASRGAEVSHVHGDREQRDAVPHRPFTSSRRGGLTPPVPQDPHLRLGEQHQRRGADQHRHHLRERAARSRQQHRRPGRAAKRGDRAEPEHAPALPGQFRAGPGHRPGTGEHQRDGVGHVGAQRRHSQREQRRVRHQ